MRSKLLTLFILTIIAHYSVFAYLLITATPRWEYATSSYGSSNVIPAGLTSLHVTGIELGIDASTDAIYTLKIITDVDTGTA
jgi:hypothetical protein